MCLVQLSRLYLHLMAAAPCAPTLTSCLCLSHPSVQAQNPKGQARPILLLIQQDSSVAAPSLVQSRCSGMKSCIAALQAHGLGSEREREVLNL